MYSSARARLAALVVLAAATAGVTACEGGGSGIAAASGPGRSAAQLQAQYERIVRQVLPSVVQISTPDSTGSGVVFDSRGDIVTNEHVIGNAKTVEVQEPAGDHIQRAKVIGKFAPDDLAVIRVEGNPDHLRPARFASAGDTQIGQIVLAMGNPLGLTDSVTQGIISATGRTVSANDSLSTQPLITAAIQTSAAINPGNSGGALVNLNGQVIGVPTLAAQLPGQAGAAPGIGFAIPSETVQNIADQIISTGKVTSSDRASLGIDAQTVASESGNLVGVAVLGVTARSTAARAGIKIGDVIVGIDDKRVTNLEQLELALSELKPGTIVTIRYTRGQGGRELTGLAKLGSLTS